MKKASPTKTKKVRTPRVESDNLCKRLAEEHPEQFAKWLFKIQSEKLKVEKTELPRAPIHADSVILSSESEILHAEFQTTKRSKVPLPFRMLDYFVGLKRKNPNKRIRQTLIVLKKSRAGIPERYEDERTLHHYDVVKMWEQDPKTLMQYEWLLPLATLCRTDSGEKLLSEVAARINQIKSHEKRSDILSMSRLAAGVRYNKDLIYQIFKEGDMLEESVIYKDILKKGELKGLQKGRQEGKQEGLQEGLQKGRQEGKQEGLQEGMEKGERLLLSRLLERRIGKLSTKSRKKIEELNTEQIEELGEALTTFRSEKDLLVWIERHTAAI